MSRFVLAHASAALEQQVRDAIASTRDEVRRIGDQPTTVRPWQLLAELAATPEVVILGPDAGVTAALQLAAQFDQERPEISVVLVADADIDTWAAALHAGVRDVVAPDAAVDELRAVLGRAAQTAAGRRRTLVPSPTLAAEPEAPGTGHVLVVASPKGGSGKTTVATNLATGLAASAPRGTVLVDLDLQFGDVASALGISPEHTIAEVTSVVGDGDAMVVKTFLTAHPSGLYVMCAPERPADADAVTGEHVTALLELLASQFTYVIVDTPPGLSEHTLAAMEQATDLLLVSSVDVPSVRGLVKELEVLDQLGLSGRRHLILNAPDPRGGLSVDDVTSSLGITADSVLPRSRAISMSTNRGVPLLADSPRAPGTRELQDLVNRFAPVTARPAGILARWKAAR